MRTSGRHPFGHWVVQISTGQALLTNLTSCRRIAVAITLPACFTNLSHRVTNIVDADVLRIVNEPTVAVITYGPNKEGSVAPTNLASSTTISVEGPSMCPSSPSMTVTSESRPVIPPIPPVNIAYAETHPASLPFYRPFSSRHLSDRVYKA